MLAQYRVVDKQAFLDKSFGAKVLVSGIMKTQFGIDYAPIYYNVSNLNLLDTLDGVNKPCDTCKTYSDDYVSFSYSPDWKIIHGNNGLVTLRRGRYFKEESPNDCTVNQECDCDDPNKHCAYEMTLTIIDVSQTLEGSTFSGDRNITFSSGNNWDGHTFQIEYPNNKLVYGNYRFPRPYRRGTYHTSFACPLSSFPCSAT